MLGWLFFFWKILISCGTFESWVRDFFFAGATLGIGSSDAFLFVEGLVDSEYCVKTVSAYEADVDRDSFESDFRSGESG